MSAEPSEMQQFEALLDACVTGLRDCARLDEEGCDDSAVYTHAVMKSADAHTAIRAFVASLAKDKTTLAFMEGSLVSISRNLAPDMGGSRFTGQFINPAKARGEAGPSKIIVRGRDLPDLVQAAITGGEKS